MQTDRDSATRFLSVKPLTARRQPGTLTSLDKLCDEEADAVERVRALLLSRLDAGVKALDQASLLGGQQALQSRPGDARLGRDQAQIWAAVQQPADVALVLQVADGAGGEDQGAPGLERRDPGGQDLALVRGRPTQLLQRLLMPQPVGCVLVGVVGFED